MSYQYFIPSRYDTEEYRHKEQPKIGYICDDTTTYLFSPDRHSPDLFFERMIIIHLLS